MDKLVTGYVKMWPRELFDIRQQNTNRLILNMPKFSREIEILRSPGVYVLYRDEHPYYVGKAGRRLIWRLQTHANVRTDTYFNFWDSFSAFAVQKEYLDEVEAILIAAMPTANSSKPRFKPVSIPEKIYEILAKRRRIDVE